MPPKQCPLRLQRLIKRENALPASDPHPLRQILKAFQAKRQNKGPETFAVKFPSEVTINLTDCTVAVRNDLALALAEIDLPAMVDLIRECPIPICRRLFWAGRADKVACDAHVGQWRKQEDRRKKKQTQAETDREREEARLRKTISRLSRTAVAVITVIMADRRRVFESIDNWACYYLRGSVRKVPSRFIVRQTLTMLVKEGYLTYQADVDPDEDQYEPREKLINLWTEMHKPKN